MKRLPKSVRKYIRKEKARLRREISNSEELEKRISKLTAADDKKEKVIQ